MLDRWLRLQADYPDAAPKAPLRLGPLDDWLDGLQQAGEGPVADRVWAAAAAQPHVRQGSRQRQAPGGCAWSA